jgi:hypothetical protein
VTHRDWHGRVKDLLALSARKPRVASRGFHHLARSIERGLKRGLHDWHLMQTLHLASIAEAAAGEHRSAADTLRRVAEHQKGLLAYEHRAYVSACAAAALELAKAGDLNGARRIVRSAEPWAKLLRPRDKLMNSARKVLRTWAKPSSTTLANRHVEPTAAKIAASERPPSSFSRRGSRAGR